MKYLRKPAVVEARQFLGGHDEGYRDLQMWLTSRAANSHSGLVYYGDRIAISTLDGSMTARTGDWIIAGVHGEIYLCNPDIFSIAYAPYQKDKETVEQLELVSKAIDLCQVCEGDGYIADGADEASLSIPCPPCFGTGYDARAAITAMKGD